MGNVAKASLFRESLVWHKLMEIYENPACYEEAGAVYEVGAGGEGCKAADTRRRRREERSRSPKTGQPHSFKKRLRMTKVCFHPSSVEEQRSHHYTTCTQLSEYASLSSYANPLWPDKPFVCNKEVYGWAALLIGRGLPLSGRGVHLTIPLCTDGTGLSLKTSCIFMIPQQRCQALGLKYFVLQFNGFMWTPAVTQLLLITHIIILHTHAFASRVLCLLYWKYPVFFINPWKVSSEISDLCFRDINRGSSQLSCSGSVIPHRELP